MFNHFCHSLLKFVTIPEIHFHLRPATQWQYQHNCTIVSPPLYMRISESPFVSTLVIWNSARVTASAELSKALTNSQVLEEGSFILESQGRLNKLIKKYGWERAVFKGNGFVLNERLHIRKHSWGRKHAETLWQSWSDRTITFAIQVRVHFVSVCVCVCVFLCERRGEKSVHPSCGGALRSRGGWLAALITMRRSL